MTFIPGALRAAWRVPFAALLLLLSAVALAATPAQEKPAEPAEPDSIAWLRAHYTKHEFRIPMRDGARLFTSVYAPKDNTKRWPILLNRTPYGVQPYGEDNPLDDPKILIRRIKETMLREGYIFAFQDVRGRMKSEGEFVHVRPHRPLKRGRLDIDESSDTWDTIDWLVKNLPGNSGKVGIWGISYPGFYSTCALIDAHPALVAVSPQAPVADWFVGDDVRHNGALFLPHAFNFLGPFSELQPPTPFSTLDQQWHSIDHGTRDGYEFFLRLTPLAKADQIYYGSPLPYWQEVMAHDTYDAYWKERDIRNYLRNVKPAVLTVGGWFDAEDLFGALATWRAIEKLSPGTSSHLVMGPWVHGAWGRKAGDGLGKVRFDAKTAEFYREKIEIPFFAHHLKGAPDPGLPKAYVFETGTNQWRRHESWPPTGATPRKLWLAAAGRLALEPPPEDAFDEYVSDPFKPVPYIEQVEIGMDETYMVADQRYASRRPDVLVYQTEPLESPLTAAGPIQVSLRVSSTGTDSDFIVKLIDVYPPAFPDPPPLDGQPKSVKDPGEGPGYSSMGGYQQLVRGEPFRGRFRNSFERPEPLVPGEPAVVAFTMPDIYHTFRRGHKIMVHVQSSWFPLVERNPQSFVKVSTAEAGDFRKATQRVYRGGPDGSWISVLAF